MAYFKCKISLLCVVLLASMLDIYVMALPKFPFSASGGSGSSGTPAPNAPTPLCPSGLTFKSDCNNCFCNPTTGVTGCTLMACPPLEPMTYYQNVTPKPTTGTAPAQLAPPPPQVTVSVARPSRADIQVSAPAVSKTVPIPDIVVKPPVAADEDQDEEEEEEQDATE